MSIDLDAIQALADAATLGPWIVDHQPNHHPDDPEWSIESAAMEFDDPIGIVDTDGLSQGKGDAEFIAASRALVPALLARVRELEAKNTNLGVQRVRTADALDRVAIYGQRLTEMFPSHTVHAEVGREISRLITTNPLPSEGGPL